MGFLATRVAVVSTCLAERIRYGTPELVGPVDDEVLFILDGVGGFQLGPLMVRRALRLERHALGTVLYHWQFGLPGEARTQASRVSAGASQDHYSPARLQWRGGHRRFRLRAVTGPSTD